DRFHIKYEKYDRVQIVLGAELDLRLTKRFNATFVNRILLRTWFWRLKNSPPQPGEGERDHWKNECHANENDNEQVRIRPHQYDQIRSESTAAKAIFWLWKEQQRKSIVSQKAKKRKAI